MKYNISYIFVLVYCFILACAQEMIWKYGNDIERNRFFNRKLREGHFVSIAFATLLVVIICLSVFIGKRYRKRKVFCLKCSISTS